LYYHDVAWIYKILHISLLSNAFGSKLANPPFAFTISVGGIDRAPLAGIHTKPQYGTQPLLGPLEENVAQGGKTPSFRNKEKRFNFLFDLYILVCMYLP